MRLRSSNLVEENAVMKIRSLMLRCAALLAVGMSFAGPATSADFNVYNGQILDPSGNPWRGTGIGILDNFVFGDFNYTGGSALAAQVLTTLPNINLIRLSCYTGHTCYTTNDPSIYDPFVTYFTSRGIVVVLEHHDELNTVLTGQNLTTESSWYAMLANYYKTNPYVMFQTMNEPNWNDADQEVATYDAIRNTGSNAIIFFEAGNWAGGDTNTIGNTSQFYRLHDVAWDLHTYDHLFSTYADILSDQNNRIVALQGTAFYTADGSMPVISLEGGNASNDTIVDDAGAAQIEINFTNPNLGGFAAWQWNKYSTCSSANNLTNYNAIGNPSGPKSLTSYGLQVANYISTRGGNPSYPGATIPAFSYLIDAAYNVWTVSGGVIYKNGVMEAGTHDVTLLLYLNGGIYQQANGGGWWSYGNGQWYTNSGDPRLSSYSAPNGSLVIAGSGESLTDASLNKWTTSWGNTSNRFICKNEVVDTATANVERLLFYNSVLYQQANGGNWWSYVGGSWNSLAGDPRPAPSANGMTIPSATQLSDVSRNIWTVSGGVIYQNGAEEVGTHDVTLLLYYNSTIYQQNNAGGWWKYENGGWTQIGGDPRP
jgi:hypothetical protein